MAIYHLTLGMVQRSKGQSAVAVAAALLADAAYQRWVDAIEIAGPGFLNIRLKPEAKRQVVREVLGAGAGFGQQPAHAVRRRRPGRRARARAGRPTAARPRIRP